MDLLVIKYFVWASLWRYWGVVAIANSAVTLCGKLQLVQEIHGTQGSKRCLWKFGGKLYKLLVGQSSMSAHSSENLKQFISHPPYSGLLYSPSVCRLPHLQTSMLCQSTLVSLVPRPHPDFISQPWRKIGRRPGIKTTSRTGNGGLG